MSKQTKLTRSAHGQECQVRLPGICNWNPATVVLAHLNGAGMGIKHSDIHGAYACSDCHAAIDGGVKAKFEKEWLKLWHLEGVIRTQKIMLELGLITHK
jgi:hypothetical protein